jgi:hypothetical protein
MDIFAGDRVSMKNGRDAESGNATKMTRGEER